MRRASVLLLVGALALLGLASTAQAKKKGPGKVKTFVSTLAVNQAVPDAVLNSTSTPVRSTITVPKKYKGKVVADLNVTGIQTTGSGPGAADDLIAGLSAPNGRFVELFANVGDQSLGPWTIDDDTLVGICNAITPPCRDGTQTLNRPFAGTSNTIYNLGGGNYPTNGPLATFNGIAMRGTWTLTVADVTPPSVLNSGTSNLNQWGLQITPAKAASK
jgi:hypothetical protein